MNPDTKQRWQTPLKRLGHLSTTAQLPVVASPTPLHSVRRFAEHLEQCANDEAVLSLMKSQPLPAARFIYLCYWLEGQVVDGAVRLREGQPAPTTTPYFFVTNLVRTYLDGYESHHPGETREIFERTNPMPKPLQGVAYARAPETRNQRAPYEQKFAGLIQTIAQAKAAGASYLFITQPWVIGDTYEEVIESLSRLAGTQIALQIVRPEN
jgi:hypothetical protein